MPLTFELLLVSSQMSASITTSLSERSAFYTRDSQKLIDARNTLSSSLSFELDFINDKHFVIELQVINEICKQFAKLNSKQKQHFLIKLLKM